MTFVLLALTLLLTAVISTFVGMCLQTWVVKSVFTDKQYIDWVKPRLDRIQAKIDRGESPSR